jgi:hypothetical protein
MAMKFPLNSASRLPGPSENQLEKVHGKSEKRYTEVHVSHFIGSPSSVRAESSLDRASFFGERLLLSTERRK